MKNWIKFDLYYLGRTSQKHEIFRAQNWNPSLEQIFKKPLFNEEYDKVGQVRDIFGPVHAPFISMKCNSPQKFTTINTLYAQISKKFHQ